MRLIDADAFLERMSHTDRFFGVRLDVCSGEDEDDYSDIFHIDAEITSHLVIDKEDVR